MAEELTARSAKQAQCESRFQHAGRQVSKELTVNIQNAETPLIDAVWPGTGVEVHERDTKKRILSAGLIFALLIAQSQVLYGQEPAPDAAPPSSPAPQSAEQIQALVAPITLLSRRPGSPGALGGDVSRSNCTRTELAVGAQGFDRSSPDAGSRQTILGSQREGAHSVSVCAGQHGKESCLDIRNWATSIATSPKM